MRSILLENCSELQKIIEAQCMKLECMSIKVNFKSFNHRDEPSSFLTKRDVPASFQTAVFLIALTNKTSQNHSICNYSLCILYLSQLVLRTLEPL